MGKKKKKKKGNLKSQVGNPVPAARNLSLADVQQEVMAHYREGRFFEAEQIFREVLKNQPDDERVHSNIGSTLLKQQKYEEAIACYREAIKLNPEYMEAHFNLGNGLKDSGKLEEAASCYRSALKIRADYWEAHINLGDVLVSQGKLEEAVLSFEAALKINMGRSETYTQLGNALLAQGKVHEASEEFRRSVEIKPNNAKSYFYLHSLVYCDSDLAPAADMLEKAIQADPNYQQAIFYLGAIREQQGNAAAASELFGKLSSGENEYNTYVDSWNYVKTRKLPTTRLFGVTQETLRYCLGECRIDGLVLEFGVRYGNSLRLIAGAAAGPVHGFDSFEGLPEEWMSEPKGTYTTYGELPEIPPNVALHVGWFDETLPGFPAENPGPIRFLHIDCDIYSSTRTVFEHLSDRVVPGTVIVFDDYLMNPTWREDEFKAFQEAVKKYGWDYEYIALSLFTKQAGVLIK